mmetsp:Transcript_3561/g.9080  ORF Transcript_3561/g.9080 Transcript_3561/m.9080 type:complete len:205 (+) Transcript_3561:99-713(+)
MSSRMRSRSDWWYASALRTSTPNMTLDSAEASPVSSEYGRSSSLPCPPPPAGFATAAACISRRHQARVKHTPARSTTTSVRSMARTAPWRSSRSQSSCCAAAALVSWCWHITKMSSQTPACSSPACRACRVTGDYAYIMRHVMLVSHIHIRACIGTYMGIFRDIATYVDMYRDIYRTHLPTYINMCRDRYRRRDTWAFGHKLAC